MTWEKLNGYQPEKVGDDFEIIKAKGLECNVNYCRVEAYTGEIPELQGSENFSYELEIVGGTTDYLGRKFWKRFNNTNEKQMVTLKNLLFTLLAMDVHGKEDLQKACEQLVDKTVIVRAWGWTPEGKSDAVQQHQIKGFKTTETAGDKPAF